MGDAGKTRVKLKSRNIVFFVKLNYHNVHFTHFLAGGSPSGVFNVATKAATITRGL